MGLGLTVGAIQSGLSNDERQAAYAKDITYATNNELGFDYLRDNMRLAARDDNRFPKHLQQVQGPLAYAIVDEVDNILIDEARTPLIISGPAHMDIGKYAEADRVARQLKKDVHFAVNEKDHTVNLTDDGVRAAEKLAGVESFYTAGNMEWPHMIDNALKAHHLYKVRCELCRASRQREPARRDHHRRRLYWPLDGGPPVERWFASSRRSQRGRQDQGGDADAGHHHAAELLQAV